MRVLVTGGAGLVGSTLIATAPVGVEVHATRRHTPIVGAEAHTVDLADPDEPVGLLAAVRPDVVIHTAYGTADLERDVVTATRSVAAACAIHDVALVHLSSDVVFDGEHAPYAEDAPPVPVHAYGRAKAQAEADVLTAVPDAAILPHVAGVRRRSTRPAVGMGRGQPPDEARPSPCSPTRSVARSGPATWPASSGTSWPCPAPTGVGRGTWSDRTPSAATTSASSWPRPTAWTLRASPLRRAGTSPSPVPGTSGSPPEGPPCCPPGLGRCRASGARFERHEDQHPAPLRRLARRGGPAGRGPRGGRPRPHLGGRGLRRRRGQHHGLPRRGHRAGRDRLGDPAPLHPHADAPGHDRGRGRRSVGRSLRARPRGIRASGHRGFPRRALRQAAHPDAGDHRDLPPGLEAGAGRVLGQGLRHPPPGGAGHRAGQAAEADHPPRSGPHPDPRRRPRAQERRVDGRDRRRLAPALLPAREGPGRLG